MATVTSLFKTIALNNNGGMTSFTTLINALNEVAAVSCVQCGEADLYDMLPLQCTVCLLYAKLPIQQDI